MAKMDFGVLISSTIMKQLFIGGQILLYNTALCALTMKISTPRTFNAQAVSGCIPDRQFEKIIS